MRTIRVPVLFLLAAALPASALAKTGDAYYCYWVDAVHKTMATTQIFPGDRLKQKSIEGVFAMDMQKRDGRQPRKYQCPWKAHAEDAAEELDALRATHRDLGFRVMAEGWNPMYR
jgi:hypothetical protein